MSSSKTKDKLIIVVSGGSGRFGSIFKNVKSEHKFYFPTKRKLNILKSKSIENYLKKIKPDVFIHGHIHRSNINNICSSIRIVIGDWNNYGLFLEIVNKNH